VNGPGVRLASNVALVIEGADLRVESLDLEGALVVELAPACQLTLRGAQVRNKGWRWMPLNPDKPMTEEMFIRWA
jgi:UDP-sugar pyrophosphorylase